jgi:predicted DNA-binding transcriptional regulator AlpA
MKRMLRLGEACRRIGCCKTTLYAKYIRPGKLPVYKLGLRAVGCLESDVERIVSEVVSKGPLDFSKPLHARSPRKPAWYRALQASLDAEEIEMFGKVLRKG